MARVKRSLKKVKKKKKRKKPGNFEYSSFAGYGYWRRHELYLGFCNFLKFHHDFCSIIDSASKFAISSIYSIQEKIRNVSKEAFLIIDYNITKRKKQEFKKIGEYHNKLLNNIVLYSFEGVFGISKLLNTLINFCRLFI